MNGFEQQAPLTPSAPKALPLKWLLVGGGGIVLVIAVIIVVAVVRGRPERLDEMGVVVRQAETTCAGEVNPEACKAETLGDLAQSSGRVEVCEALKGDDFDQCVWGAAREQGKPEWCDSMKNREQVSLCKDGTYLAAATSSGDQGLCEKITSADMKTACVSIILGPVNGKNCASRGLPEETCRAYAVIDVAAASHDASKCSVIQDEELRFLCLDLVGSGGAVAEPTDSDGDGLSDADEAQYKTDPNNPDTDGDGFSDGEEVRNGYNPLGAGKLE